MGRAIPTRNCRASVIWRWQASCHWARGSSGRQQSFPINVDQGQAQAAQTADYTCPSVTQNQSVPSTPTSGQLQSAFAGVAGAAALVVQDGQTVLPLIDTSASQPAVTGTVVPVSLSAQQPSFSLGSATDKVCVTRDATTPLAKPAAMVGSGPSSTQSIAALYANTSASTDTVLRPTPDGMESFEQIRDSLAPQAFTWDVSLHDGQALQQLPNGDVAVINGPDTQSPADPNFVPDEAPLDDGGISAGPPSAADDSPSWFAGAWSPTVAQVSDLGAQLQSADAHASTAYDMTQGQVVAVFHAAMATDALGQGVPTSLTASGNQVTLTVSHLGGGYTYPILADPTASSAKAARRAAFGLSDQSTNGTTFTKYGETKLATGPLHPRYARRNVPWNFDAMSSDAKMELAAWISNAHSTPGGPVTVILSLNGNGGDKILDRPTPRAFEQQFMHWRQWAPASRIAYWSAWNEPDDISNPLRDVPDAPLAAQYWEKAASHCKSRCTVLAGEFSGQGFHRQASYIAAYVGKILDDYNRKGGFYPKPPSIWSIHGYSDIINTKPRSRYNNPTLREFVRYLDKRHAGHPRVWMPEGGVQYRTGGHPTRQFVKHPERQTPAARDFLTMTGPNTLNRVDTASYYSYLSDPPPTPGKVPGDHAFSFGMLNSYGGQPGNPDPWDPNQPNAKRPAWCVLALNRDPPC